jgi:hypothetical protein
MQLGKKRRNEIIERLRETALPLADFTTAEGDEELVIEHAPTGSKLSLRTSVMGFIGSWQVGKELQRQAMATSPGDVVAEWLQELEQDIATPDLWAEFTQNPGIDSLTEDESQQNTAFDKQEIAQIEVWGEQVKAEAAEQYGLDDPQTEVVADTIDYLVGAAKRGIGRVDWLNLAVGALLQPVLSQIYEPGVAQGILRNLVAVVGHLFGHPLPSLGPGVF